MSDAPDRIWLQWIPGGSPFSDEITWCAEAIHEDDTGYVREDIADKRLLREAKDALIILQDHHCNGLEENHTVVMDKVNSVVSKLAAEVGE